MSSGQLDMLKTQIALVLQFLLKPLDILTRLYSGRADHGPPDSGQAGFFTGILSGFEHGRAPEKVMLLVYRQNGFLRVPLIDRIRAT
jgi:hypothetical protein